jgi:hypothetical protein
MSAYKRNQYTVSCQGTLRVRDLKKFVQDLDKMGAPDEAVLDEVGKPGGDGLALIFVDSGVEIDD